MQSILFFAAILRVAFARRTDVCSQVQLMSQYCTSQGVNRSGTWEVYTTKALKRRMDVNMKEIEARLRHTLGEPPEINYTFVEETISARFQGVEERVIAKLGSPPKVNYSAIEESISNRFRRLEALVNGVGEDGSSIVDYARIIDQIEDRYTAIRGYVDAKFARLVNDTSTYKQAVKSMDKRMKVSDCRDIDVKDAKLCNITGGVFDIYRGLEKYEVYCDYHTDGGGWTVFQRRMDGSLLFNRTWEEYVNGFGERHKEFWLGLKHMNKLLQIGTHELRIDVMNKYGWVRFANYGIFYVAGKSRNYNLMLQSHTGDLGNSLSSGYPFSTSDRNRYTYYRNCAEDYQGGWWYSNCGQSALNGKYKSNKVYWSGFGNIVRTEMKFRRLGND